ncbi:AzlC family ABC transporter permease [Selenihalanaerobacter shriftii]|uniref:4-azaleucine resistance probable transporter AzlC n=1 Tax=Selenihalanaerobacter shriftii TaxID=142842 RepID=A0A1T4PSZ4_9FIRM|nr:AzlC family ABC transporter permease [Selenihalanaerobacter shriftii]SJZ94672.1 4-azaleucine resistance probable transporter AzlC [Selenihalanaerobacter shriftii]
MAAKNLSFKAGVKAGVPIALGYIPIAITFGLVAKSTGVPDYISIMMSLLVFAGASQFVAVNLLALSTGHWQIIVTTLIVNLRHFLMSASMAQRIKKNTPKGLRALLAFGITDETFSIASLRPENELSFHFVLGLNLVSYSSWVLGTAGGVFLGMGLPQTLQTSMGIALYAMFIGILVPNLKKSYAILIVSLITVVINTFLSWTSFFSSISTGWRVVITTILASALGSYFFPKEAV